MKQYSAMNYSYSDILGTPQHENRKEKMKQYSAIHYSYSDILGTPQHENRKEKMKQYSAIHFSEKFSTPQHENKKAQMRSFSATTEQKDRNRCSKQNNSNITSLQKVKKFRKEIQEGPYYVYIDLVYLFLFFLTTTNLFQTSGAIPYAFT